MIVLTNDENKPTARIENWWEGNNCLFGSITKHQYQSDFKSKLQMTSPLIELDIENGFAETENTFYTLGKPKYLEG